MSMAGRMVRYARRRAGLTQRELATKAGIPQETIARIERGRVDPRVGTLDRLLQGAEFGLEAMPRLGIGIDRTLFPLRLSPSERASLAGWNNRHATEFRDAIRIRR